MKKVLVIDNYDSFTYNLVHYLEALNCEVTVYRNDEFELDEIAAFTKILLSPGPGIPDDERKRIFDMFYTMERGDRGRMGTGLGLTIVQGIIGSHLGTVEAVSGPDGKGTTVRIKLPIGSDSPGNSE